MAEADRIRIANLACLGAGVNIIGAFDESSAEAKFLNQWYELTVKAELSVYSWNFATKAVSLGSPLAATPDSRFNVAYQVPNDCVSIDTVFVGDSPINYDRHEDQIHTNDTANDDVYIEYRYRIDETKWLPYFELLVVYRLATMLSFSIARKDDVASSMKGLADEWWRKCKTQDAQAVTNKKVKLNKITRARGGRLDKFWRNR